MKHLTMHLTMIKLWITGADLNRGEMQGENDLLVFKHKRRRANWIEPETALQVFTQVMQGEGVYST